MDKLDNSFTLIYKSKRLTKEYIVAVFYLCPMLTALTTLFIWGIYPRVDVNSIYIIIIFIFYLSLIILEIFSTFYWLYIYADKVVIDKVLLRKIFPNKQSKIIPINDIHYILFDENKPIVSNLESKYLVQIYYEKNGKQKRYKHYIKRKKKILIEHLDAFKKINVKREVLNSKDMDIKLFDSRYDE
jgi:hypothetical protein